MQRTNRQYQQKNNSMRFVALALLLVLAVAGWWYIDNEQQSVLPIENVKLEGELKHVSAIVLREKIASVLHGGYFTVDLDNIRNALLELPWVQDVSVRRQWPLGLYIKVSERIALARWGQQALISDQGALFSPADMGDIAGLPQFSGPDGLHAKVITFYNELNRQLSQHGFNVTELTLDQRRAWAMRLSNNVAVKLGRKQINSRLQRLVQVMAMHERLDMQAVAVIDMRYPNGFAMRMNNKDSVGTSEQVMIDLRRQTSPRFVPKLAAIECLFRLTSKQIGTTLSQPKFNQTYSVFSRNNALVTEV